MGAAGYDEDVTSALQQVQTAAQATHKAALELTENSYDFAEGLSLLNVRPHVLLNSVHTLVHLLALRLLSASSPDASASSALTDPFSTGRGASDVQALDGASVQKILNELAGELVKGQESMDKSRSMESKLDYQIKKLVGLAEADDRAPAAPEDVEEDPLSFRPNIAAIATDKKRPVDSAELLDDADDVYRPPRVAAVPYPEAGPSNSRKERRAPALLSEFAATLDPAPLLESTSGLAVRPVTGAHSNSISKKRAEELKRINDWEEDNMTRLVTSKRESKRRREDEEALAMGFGVGGARNRRRNGLEAELEGVLGDRGSKGVWESVSAGLGREDRADLGKRRAAGAKAGGKKRFERDVRNHAKRQK